MTACLHVHGEVRYFDTTSCRIRFCVMCKNYRNRSRFAKVVWKKFTFISMDHDVVSVSVCCWQTSIQRYKSDFKWCSASLTFYTSVLLIQTIMLCMVDGDRHRGKPPRRWVDDMVDWCGRSLLEVVWLTAAREEWRRVITGLSRSQGPWVTKKEKTTIFNV